MQYGRQSINQDDIDAVVEVLKSDRLTQGPQIEAFEEELCEVTGARYAVVCCNGTMALELVFAALRGESQRERRAVVPANTFVATAAALKLTDHVPYVVDVGPRTWNINTSQQIGHYDVLVGVDFAGLPCDRDELRRLADAKGAWLVVDAAHSLGARYKALRIGETRVVDATTLSFHPVKSITTGEGGAILTDKRWLAERVRQLRDHGRVSGVSTMPSINGRLSDLACALGRSQLRRLGDFMAQRHVLVENYRKNLDGSGIGVQFRPDRMISANHLMVVHVADKQAIKRMMSQKGIYCGEHYMPLCRAAEWIEDRHCPNADTHWRQCLSLPLYCGMTTHDVNVVCDALLDAVASVEARGDF